MPKYTVRLGPIATDKVFQTGETIELEALDAQPLLTLKVIEELPEPKAEPKPEPKSEKLKSTKSE